MTKRRIKNTKALRNARILGTFANCFGIKIIKNVVIFRDERAREMFDAAATRYSARYGEVIR